MLARLSTQVLVVFLSLGCREGHMSVTLHQNNTPFVRDCLDCGSAFETSVSIDSHEFVCPKGAYANPLTNTSFTQRYYWAQANPHRPFMAIASTGTYDGQSNRCPTQPYHIATKTVSTCKHTHIHRT